MKKVTLLNSMHYCLDGGVHCKDDFNNEPVRRVGSAKLSWEMEKAIKAISAATDLNTDEITTIFSKKTGASIGDVAYRLHRQSAHDRVSF